METALHPEILGKLSLLRRRLRGRLAAEGAAAALLVLVAGALATLALDWSLSLERPARIVLVALWAAGLAVTLWRRLVGPLTAPMTTRDLALLVEDRHRQIGDRLISAVQFDSTGHHGPESPALVARVIAQTNEMVAGLDVADIVERRFGRRLVLAAACAIGLLAGLCLWQGPLMACWFQRNLLLGETPWPQDIYLTVTVPGQEGPDYVAVRGEDLRLLVQARRTTTSVAWPDEVTLHVQGWDSQKIEPARSDASRFVHTLRGVNEEFAFYVTCDRDKLDRQRPHRVRVIDPPGLKDVTFVVRYPAYMVRDEPTETLAGPRSGISVPVGAEVSVRALATKDITRARLHLEAAGVETVTDMTISPAEVRGEAAPRPRLLSGQFALPPGEWKESRGLRISLEDTDKAANPRAAMYRVEPRADKAPEVRLGSYDIGRKITARATIPLSVSVKDDNGLADVWAELGKKADFASPGRWPLLGKAVGARQFASPDPARTSERGYEPFKLDIEPLGLKADDQADVYVRVRAADNMPSALFGGPNVAASDKVLVFTVVPDDVVSDILLQRQRGLRVDLAAAREEQGKALAKTQAAEKALPDRAQAAEALEGSARGQQGVSASCSRVAEGFVQVLTEMVNNRLGTPKAHDVLSREVIEPLRAVVADGLTVEGSARAAVKETDPAKLRAQIAEIQRLQQQMLARMDRILDTMEQAASLQEAINRATTIRKALTEVQDKTRDWLEGELRGIVAPEDGGATRPATQPASQPAP
ncbi:MAG: hypothetical protein NTV86_12175 [Planctomycetota bacterium]|nr:hypothetical protein [Planctomycetota bacterium]